MKKPGFTMFAAALAAFAAPAAALAQTEPSPPAPEVALEPPPAPPPPKPKGLPVSAAYDGGLVLRADDGTFELKINGLLQTRWELVSSPPATDGGDRESDARFVLPRARIGLSGYVFKDTQFKAEYAFSDAGNARLRDFYLNQVLLDGKLQIRAGQWKRPFNRNEIVSDFATEFLEKAITNRFGSRDLGVGLSNGYDKSPEGLEWVVALFNGTGDAAAYPVRCTGTPPTCSVGTPTNTPTDFNPEAQVRVGWNHGGIKGYSEADLEGGPLRFAVAAGFRGRNLRDSDELPFGFDVGLDAVVKVMGLDVWGAVFIIKNKDVDPQLAFHLQAGYMLLPKTAQVAARFAMNPLAPPAEGADQEYNLEARAAFNWFFSKSHAFKWATDVGFTKETTDGAEATIQLRSGAQLVF